jgi:hypothetical protein
MLNLCELTAVFYETEDRGMLEQVKGLQAYHDAKEAVRAKNW